MGERGGGGLHRGSTLGSLVVLEVAVQGTQGVEGVVQFRLHLQRSAVVPGGTRVVAAGPQQVGVEHVGAGLSSKHGIIIITIIIIALFIMMRSNCAILDVTIYTLHQEPDPLHILT